MKVACAAAKLADARRDFLEAVVAERMNGRTLAEIAKDAGVTPQRIHQILREHASSAS